MWATILHYNRASFSRLTYLLSTSLYSKFHNSHHPNSMKKSIIGRWKPSHIVAGILDIQNGPSSGRSTCWNQLSGSSQQAHKEKKTAIVNLHLRASSCADDLASAIGDLMLLLHVLICPLILHPHRKHCQYLNPCAHIADLNTSAIHGRSCCVGGNMRRHVKYFGCQLKFLDFSLTINIPRTEVLTSHTIEVQ